MFLDWASVLLQELLRSPLYSVALCTTVWDVWAAALSWVSSLCFQQFSYPAFFVKMRNLGILLLFQHSVFFLGEIGRTLANIVPSMFLWVSYKPDEPKTIPIILLELDL